MLPSEAALIYFQYSTPPWCEQVPDPVEEDSVPSLQWAPVRPD